MSARTEVVRLTLQLLQPLVPGHLQLITDAFDSPKCKKAWARVELEDDRPRTLTGQPGRKTIRDQECRINIFKAPVSSQQEADAFAQPIEQAIQAGIRQFIALTPKVNVRSIGTRVKERNMVGVDNADLQIFFTYSATEPPV